jgi:beta-1,4-mannosyltransferase
VRVLSSFGTPLPTTNPYIIMLDRALSACREIEHRRFTWRSVFAWRYDVFHAHWTEAVTDARSRPRARLKRALLVLAVLWMAVRRVTIVQTLHNVQPPAGLTPLQRFAIAVLRRRTALVIRLNSTTEVPEGVQHRTILHGHYRDWFAEHPRDDIVDGRVGYFGLVRRYKGVETLIDAFLDAQTLDPSLTLRVGGKPSTDLLAQDLIARADGHGGIRLDLHFLDDAELVELVTQSQLVALPYRFMHNSGSVLAALSLDRPVLVPRNAAHEKLATEVGAGWVQFFDGVLTAQDLLDALASTAGLSGRPDLSRRSWRGVGAAHLEAYRLATAGRDSRR